jgi:hypothetical protein
VYVDYDPIVLAHGRALLVSKPQGRSVYIDADMREPERILSHPVTRDTLDFTKPVALVFASVLHFCTADHQLRRIVEPLPDALPSGSYVTASHATAEFAPATLKAGALLPPRADISNNGAVARRPLSRLSQKLDPGVRIQLA